MKKVLILFCAITILLIVSISFKTQQSKPNVVINGHYFTVDVAKTDEQQEKGLSIYTKLPLDKGMIFPFEKPGFYGFWMKDMKFPIDIIYIGNNKIVDIFEKVPPPKSELESLPVLEPKSSSDFVLEINSGLSQKYKFKIGDIVRINY